MLSFEDKIFIKNLWECERFSARRLLREFPNKNWIQFTGLVLAVDGSWFQNVLLYVFLNFLR